MTKHWVTSIKRVSTFAVAFSSASAPSPHEDTKETKYEDKHSSLLPITFKEPTIPQLLAQNKKKNNLKSSGKVT